MGFNWYFDGGLAPRRQTMTPGRPGGMAAPPRPEGTRPGEGAPPQGPGGAADGGQRRGGRAAPGEEAGGGGGEEAARGPSALRGGNGGEAAALSGSLGLEGAADRTGRSALRCCGDRAAIRSGRAPRGWEGGREGAGGGGGDGGSFRLPSRAQVRCGFPALGIPLPSLPIPRPPPTFNPFPPRRGCS